MNPNRLVIPVFALVLGMISGPVTAKARGAQQGPPPPGYGQDRGDWDAPPRQFNEMQRRGFQDGIDGAQKDFGNHRQPDVNNRWEYTHPDVPREMWDPYRNAFRRGYEQAMSHLMGNPSQYGGNRDRDDWNVPPNYFNDIQRRGFQDGIDGAQKDFGNHRRPDVNNRWEYTHPNVPQGMWDPYRNAFRRGYEQAMSHLMGVPDQYGSDRNRY